ncbi:hypothetical protein AJ87_41530 [Rhizobium yanglingense]|nr:hypothetical protein AJ87_41530 [Rhizobium yanglingense]
MSNVINRSTDTAGGILLPSFGKHGRSRRAMVLPLRSIVNRRDGCGFARSRPTSAASTSSPTDERHYGRIFTRLRKAPAGRAFHSSKV